MGGSTNGGESPYPLLWLDGPEAFEAWVYVASWVFHGNLCVFPCILHSLFNPANHEANTQRKDHEPSSNVDPLQQIILLFARIKMQWLFEDTIMLVPWHCAWFQQHGYWQFPCHVCNMGINMRILIEWISSSTEDHTGFTSPSFFLGWQLHNHRETPVAIAWVASSAHWPVPWFMRNVWCKKQPWSLCHLYFRAPPNSESML